MNAVHPRTVEQAAIQTQLGAIFVSLELSRSTWLVTSLSPGGGEKLSKHSVRAGDVAGLLERFSSLTQKARARTGQDFRIIAIQEAGLAALRNSCLTLITRTGVRPVEALETFAENRDLALKAVRSRLKKIRRQDSH